ADALTLIGAVPSPSNPHGAVRRPRHLGTPASSVPPGTRSSNPAVHAPRTRHPVLVREFGDTAVATRADSAIDRGLTSYRPPRQPRWFGTSRSERSPKP